MDAENAQSNVPQGEKAATEPVATTDTSSSAEGGATEPVAVTDSLPAGAKAKAVPSDSDVAFAPPAASNEAEPQGERSEVDILIASIEESNLEEVERLTAKLGTGLLPAGFNVLMYAAANKKGSSVVQSLIPKFDLNVRSTGKIFNFPWNEEYVLAGRVDERFGEEVTAFDEGLTAIQLAALSGSLRSFNDLLKAGASLGPETAEGRTIQQLIGLRYEPGDADSKKVLAKALLESTKPQAEETKTPAVETKSAATEPAADATSSDAPNVVFHLPAERSESEAKKEEPPVFLFSVQGQQGAIPQVGFGTALMPFEAIKSSLKVGIRHLDGALLYANQEAVGQAIRESGLKREEIFVTSKVSFFPAAGLWMYNENNLKGKEAASVDICLKQLGVEYVDLMLLHNGITTTAEYNASMAPHMFEIFALQGNPQAVTPDKLPGGESIRDAVLLGLREKAKQSRAKDPARAAQEARAFREQAWRDLEQAQKDGKCKYIGVANYPPELLLEMKEYAKVMPCVNQVELHPRFSRPDLQKVCKELGIVLTAYGSGNSVTIEKSPIVAGIAKRLNKSPLQVVLKWTLQLGVVVIPASRQEAHIKENMDLFDFTLSEEDMAKLNAMNEDHTYYWDPRPTQDTVR